MVSPEKKFPGRKYLEILLKRYSDYDVDNDNQTHYGKIFHHDESILIIALVLKSISRLHLISA